MLEIGMLVHLVEYRMPLLQRYMPIRYAQHMPLPYVLFTNKVKPHVYAHIVRICPYSTRMPHIVLVRVCPYIIQYPPTVLYSYSTGSKEDIKMCDIATKTYLVRYGRRAERTSQTNIHST